MREESWHSQVFLLISMAQTCLCTCVHTLIWEHSHTHTSSHTSTCTIIYRNYNSYIFCDIWQANWKKISNPGILSCSRAFKWKETVYAAWGQVYIFYGRERDTYLMRWRSRKCKPALSWSQSEVWEQTENKSMWVEQTCKFQSLSHSGSKKELRMPRGPEKNR